MFIKVVVFVLLHFLSFCCFWFLNCWLMNFVIKSKIYTCQKLSGKIIGWIKHVALVLYYNIKPVTGIKNQRLACRVGVHCTAEQWTFNENEISRVRMQRNNCVRTCCLSSSFKSTFDTNYMA